jgi:hypothetical protein
VRSSGQSLGTPGFSAWRINMMRFGVIAFSAWH